MVRRHRRGWPDHDDVPEGRRRHRLRVRADRLPTGAAGVPSGWLYTWSLSIPKGDPNEAAALKYIEWATGKQYLKATAARRWAGPTSTLVPGTRPTRCRSTRRRRGRSPRSRLASINGAKPLHPTLPSVKIPYIGVQFVDEPWFISLGTEVSNQISAAIAGTESVSRRSPRHSRTRRPPSSKQVCSSSR